MIHESSIITNSLMLWILFIEKANPIILVLLIEASDGLEKKDKLQKILQKLETSSL